MNSLNANVFSGRRSRTFRRTTLNALLAPLMFAAVGGVLLALDLDRAETVSGLASEHPASTSPGRADVLMERHRCWAGAAPVDMVGAIPGHAVVTTAQGRVVYSVDQVGPALEQLAYDGTIPGEGVDHDLQVWGFCR